MSQNQEKLRERKLRQQLELRNDQARKFRSFCSDAGLKTEDVGKLLHVTPRTVRNWISGRTEIPYSAFKLLRVLRYFELPGRTWHGWIFHSGKLWTPEGYAFDGNDGRWWSLLVRQARCFRSLYEQSSAFTKALMAMSPEVAEASIAAQGLRGQAAGSDGRRGGSLATPAAAGRPGLAGEAGQAAEPAALDLSLGHLGTHQRRNAASSPVPTVQASSKGVIHG